MSRPLRIEFCGALYHVTSRGDRREMIYEDDQDRQTFLALLADVVSRFNWCCHGYCLMGNHYHLLIETPDGNLSQGMRQLNGVYTQASNRRHRRVGHLFQRRYKAILVDANSYLLELTRYVVLNPVRAGMVSDPADWPWSSYRAMVGLELLPPWLAVDGLLAQFDRNRQRARREYVRFVADGLKQQAPWDQLRQQVYLGDEAFVSSMQAKLTAKDEQDINVPRIQRRAPPPTLSELANRHPGRDRAMVAAYATGAYSYQSIADYFGVHFTTVGRAVRKARGREK